MLNNSIKDDFHSEIMAEYERIRENNKTATQNFKTQIYLNLPRIEEIDRELNSLAISAGKDMLKGNKDAQGIIEFMKKKIKGLSEEKEKILKNAGVDPKCLENAYNCEICKDKGWTAEGKCVCYQEKLKKLIRKNCNINGDKMHSFDKFDITLYSPEIDGEYGASPRENAGNILDTAKKFASMDGSSAKRLLLYGGTGLGKTFTSECIAKEFIKNNKSVFYTSAPRLFTIFEDYKFGRNTSEDAKKTIEYICNADLLIIDDLGTEFRTQYVDSILFDLINTAVNEDRYMIISTNLSPDQLESTYSARIFSRIFGNFEAVLFFGKDIRLK